jgi:predicted ABC-type ATPase
MAAPSNDEAQSGAKMVIVFAGPNGSGKSTINSDVLADPALGFDGVYINADDIAKTLPGDFDSPRDRNIAAAEKAEQLRLDCLGLGKSFAFETVMSTPEKVALMTQARARGFDVHLVFVTLESADLNIQRVANRVREGGHDVPADAIRSRYEAAMKLLPVAIEQATTVLVFDNSVNGRGAMLVAHKMRDAELLLSDDASTPVWVFEKLQRQHHARVESLAVLATALQADGFQTGFSRLQMAEAANGLKYDGRMVAVTALHLLQQADKGDYFIHSRALAQDRTHRAGAVESVTYAYDRGKIARLEPERDR